MDIAELDGLYAGLIPALRSSESRNPDLNATLARILEEEDGRTGGPLDWAGNLDDAMGLVPVGTWFLWNHFGFQVVPNRPMAGGAWSNAVDYYPKTSMRDGAPVAYESMAFDSPENRRALPRHVCIAVLKARRAGILKERAKREGRYFVVQTGQGPLLAAPGGGLVEIPYGQYVTASGTLVPYDDAVHKGSRVEAPDA